MPGYPTSNPSDEATAAVGVYYDLTTEFNYKDLLTWQNMDKIAEALNIHQIHKEAVGSGTVGVTNPHGLPLWNLYKIGSDSVASGAAADTEESEGSQSYIKVKEIKYQGPQTQNCRVLFDLAANDAVYAAYGKIYKNGSPVGIERSVVDGIKAYTTFSEDLQFAGNDLIQLYIHGSGGQVAWCKSFRIYQTDPFKVIQD